jgi:hypothetical protein
MIFNETILYSNISAFFDIGQDNQANYFINKYKQNESVYILYDKNNPKNIYFDTPKHKWKDSNKSGYIAGWVFIGLFIAYASLNLFIMYYS